MWLDQALNQNIQFGIFPMMTAQRKQITIKKNSLE